MPDVKTICETTQTILEAAAAALEPICESLQPAATQPIHQVTPEQWRTDVVNLARGFIGYTEKPNGWSEFGQWYQQQVDGGAHFATTAWCGCFASYLFSRVGFPLPVMQHEGYTGFAKAEIGRAYCQAKGWATTTPKPGDIVFLNWDADASAEHVEIVSRVDGAQIWTIGGNVGNPGKVSEQPRNRASILLIADVSSVMRGGPCWQVPPYVCTV